MEAIFNFESFRLVKVDYSLQSEPLEKIDDEILGEIGLNIGISDIDNDGIVGLELDVVVQDGGTDYKRDINVVMQGLFKFSPGVTLDDEKRDLLRINGTAIMMPYIRNILSMLTGFDNSTEHLLLPTMNVHKLVDNESN